MWHSARASTGSERSRLQPPSAVSVASSARSLPSASNPTFHDRVEAVPLARHRHVLRAVEPQPHRAAGQRGAERGDRGVAVRLHLLAAEAAAHPQALHGDLVAAAAQHVRDDLLGLARVLGAGLDEDLPVLVDVRERRVRLQVEVLLAGELELALEHVGAACPTAASGSPRRTVGRAPWKLSAAMASVTVTSDGSGSYSTSTLPAPIRAASRVSPSTQQTACPR